MELLTKMNAIYALILALATISSVNSQCCDFETTLCTWNLGQWYPSYSVTPNLSPYGYFLATEPSPNYIFLQDRSGSVLSINTFTIPAEGTVISFDYFFDSPTVDPANYLQVYFVNSVTSFSVLLASVPNEYYMWRHFQLQCDSSNSYCCGGSAAVPCQGQIQVTGYVNSALPQALFAVDNIGTTCGSVIPTTPPTLPPPTPTSCCQFETNICGITLYNWYWSYQLYPSIYVPPHSGYFIWSEVIGSQIASYVQTAVGPSTIFSMFYYISSPNVALNAYFQPLAGPQQYLGSFVYTYGAFTTATLRCNSCCGGGICDGQLFLDVTGSPGAFIVAVDDVERDNGCHGSFPCCYFDDSFMCGFSSGYESGYQWQLYGTSFPYYPPISPGSSYVYFETVGYVGPNDLNVILRSSQVSINSDTVFRGNVFARVPPSTASALFVNFHNINTGVVTQLDYLKDTSSVWTLAEFNCDSLHGNCCQGYTSCIGYVEFLAYVQVGDSALYAVDAFEILYNCGFFPGSSNATAIEFHPVSA